MRIIIAKNERLARSISNELGCYHLPDFDGAPFSENSPHIRSERIEILYKILKGDIECLVCTLTALSRYTISPDDLLQNVKTITNSDKFTLSSKELYELGYERVFTVREVGEFSIKGDIVDIYAPLYQYPIRIELFDEVVEDIRFFDPITQKSIEKVNEAMILPIREYISGTHEFDTIPKKADSSSTIFEYIKKAEFFSPNFQEALEEYQKKLKELKELAGDKWQDYYNNSLLPLNELLEKIGEVKTIEIEERKLLVVEQPSKIEALPVTDFEDLMEGDIVVHKDYGIGKFEKVERIKSPLGEKDFIKIRYSDSVLYVPIDRINRIHKYIGSKQVTLDSLKSSRWRRRVKRAKKDIEKRVKELVKLYAKRAEVKGLALYGDPELEKAFADSFPYIETADQIKAIEEVFEDLASDKPMDRLISGDSGFGKTEVAMRAAVRAVTSGKQVAVMAPTVVLANQHYKTFRERMEPFGIKVEILDSTKKGKEREKILKKLQSGEIDVIIGTHSLLSDKVKFADLGLVVIDEEQKFGVEQKEKLKKLRISVNVLSMSATPIPRTLHMALSGMKDISTINTPPIGRKPVTVYVEPWSETLIRSAVLRELTRGGQIIYVHNRVEEIPKVYEKLRKLLPEVSIGIAHGKINKRKLEKIMETFERGEIDLLLCTTVIESGIDIGTANTIIVDDAHRYGLAQLYQLRGRVGRRKVRGYAYFLYPRGASKEALQRLEVIKTHTGSGSGFEIALRDLEMRGYGDVLGIEQSGHIESIGYKYYVELLKGSIGKFQGKEVEEIDVEITGFPGDVMLPEDYISDPMERLRLYRRISSIKSFEEIEEMEKELLDRFGRLPEPAKNLLTIAKLRIAAHKLGIKKVEIGKGSILLLFKGNPTPEPFKNLKFALIEKKNAVLVIEEFEKFLHHIFSI